MSVIPNLKKRSRNRCSHPLASTISFPEAFPLITLVQSGTVITYRNITYKSLLSIAYWIPFLLI